MFGSLSGIEILVILVLALLLFGPRRLPQIGRTMGKALSEFRKATGEFRTALEREVDVETVKQAKSSLQSLQEEARQVVREANPLTTRPARPAAQRPSRESGAADSAAAPAQPADSLEKAQEPSATQPPVPQRDGADERDGGTP